ncbi:hypothetical protein G647_10309 [Cladophialophora carrionii CBS 160.54]|uniref:Uncharacterized protein n=1 Tax=Cladophialophora carrionii CBS 160.54 TaxID=1279043 RepID=V9DKP1_9EURO|nr:uncharacterized protein G647_10309 [Cladophialophora carrionii CBS 160.54]ETI26863.1 hypothetical protein G647_10309 [Cladophialophora carrionii CBS 160.54]
MLLEKRKLCPPRTGVQSCTGESPFTTIHEYHLWLCEVFPTWQDPDRSDIEEWRELQDRVTK